MTERKTRKYDELEIDLIEVLVGILRSVGPLLLCTAAFALLLAAWRVHSVRQEAQQVNMIENAAAELERTRAEIDRRREHLTHSILLNLDPWHVYKRDAVWYVRPDAADGQLFRQQSAALASAYASLLGSEDFCAYVRRTAAPELGSCCIRELLLARADTESGMLRLTVIADSGELAEGLYGAAADYLAQVKPRLDAAIGAHRTELISASAYDDGDVAGTMDGNTNEAAGVQGGLTVDMLSAISNSRKVYENELTALGNRQTTLEQQLAQDTAIRSGVKYGIIGAILGAAVWCCLVLLRVALRGPATNEEMLRELTGAPVLASVRRFSDKGARQRLLTALTGDARRAATAEDAAVMARDAAMPLLTKDGGDVARLLLVGRDEADVAELAKQMDGEGLSVKAAAGDIVTDRQAAAALEGCEDVVLVTRKERETYREVARELERLTLLQKRVVGVIAL